MYPGHWAKVKPDVVALTNTVTGETLTWQELDKRSNQVAQLLASLGLGYEDHVALLSENMLDFFCVAWGVMRTNMVGTHWEWVI